MKIDALIVDDEKNSREVLKELLHKFCPEVHVAGEAPSADAARKLIQEKKPELVFLDIQMPTGNGFELLKRFDPVPFSVIFVTSFDQFAINAIKFSALDYLLKPVEVHELRAAVQKAMEIKKNIQPVVLNLLNNLDEGSEKKIAVHAQGHVKFINATSIVCIEGDGAYSAIHTVAEKVVTSKTLKEIEDFFHDPSFVRINKSITINTSCVKEYTKGELCIVTLINGNTYEISRRKKQEVLERLKKK